MQYLELNKLMANKNRKNTKEMSNNYLIYNLFRISLLDSSSYGGSHLCEEQKNSNYFEPTKLIAILNLILRRQIKPIYTLSS